MSDRRSRVANPRIRLDPPELLRGNGSRLVERVPARDLESPAELDVPHSFWRMAQARKMRDLTRAEWCRLTGTIPPHAGWLNGYPHAVSPSLRLAAEKLARELAG